MIVHVHSIMRNESWMLPHFLRHYEGSADRIFVWDDHSDDDTREVAGRHPLVTVRAYPFDYGFNERDMNACFLSACRTESRGVADWAIYADADEFLQPDAGSLREHLTREFAAGAEAIRSVGVLCGASDLPQTSGPLWESLPYRKPHKRYSKTIVLSPRFDPVFGRGRHATRLPTRLKVSSGLTLFHCCYLSPEWTEARITHAFSRMTMRRDEIGAERLENERQYRLRRALREGCWPIADAVRRRGWTT